LYSWGFIEEEKKGGAMKPWYKSPIGWVLLACFFTALFALTGLAKADDVVQFPEAELERESVLPVFDSPQAVKHRNVPTLERVEVAGFLGTSLNDPFITSVPIGAEVSYHVSELHSFGLIAEGFANSTTSYVGQIQQPNSGGQNIPFNQNPTPTFAGLLEYEFTPYYGKISITKQTVFNLNISVTARAGFLSLSSGGGATGGLGLNERFFFTRNLGIKADLYSLIYQKTDVVPLSGAQKGTIFDLFFAFGVVYLFPTL
jgi:outer membrane beta-barrel protein